ncbi:MAG: type ISP restriction/modification enzyme [Parvibaculaceae bacterium]
MAILPYYVANLNIEATYYGVAGQYAEFENLCFVDTLDNVAGLGIRAGYQHDMFAALSEENVERVKRQNKRKISVIIGNPPYNAWQENFNMRNPNRPYRRIDERIRGTYFRLGTAQNRNSVYDMYTRFFRWASDRLHDDGVLALITNRNFIEKAAFDGFRRAIEREFNEIHVLDLGGDVRANPKISGTKHNVFGIQTGVAISFMVKRHRQQGCKIFYARRPEFDTKEDKLGFLAGTKASAIAWQRIEPNEKAIWLQQTDNDWDELIPMASKAAKAGRSGPKAQAVFKLFSSGLKTQRDEWTYDVSRKALEEKMRYFVSAYEATRKDRDFGDRDTIKWDAVLASALSRGIKKAYHAEQIRPAAYRPFTRKFVYFDQTFNGRTYQLPDMFPLGTENIVISFSGVGSRADFCVSSWNGPVDLHYGAAADAYQVVSRYRYTKDGERVDNVTDWALRKFREAYGPSRLAGSGLAPQDKDGEADGREHPLAAHPSSGPPLRAFPPSPARGEEKQAAITKDNIFHYVYGVLHDPVYRETYALNLKREFPRIPFYPNFRQWTEWGRRLMALHIGYEAVEPWPLKRTDVADDKARAAGVPPKTLLKPDRDNDIIRIDGETTLSGVPAAAWKYRLGNRSGLEWILDQYRERTPKDLTIREKFNTYRFEYHKEKVIDLLMRVTRVSVETMEIVEEMQRARR